MTRRSKKKKKEKMSNDENTLGTSIKTEPGVSISNSEEEIYKSLGINPHYFKYLSDTSTSDKSNLVLIHPLNWNKTNKISENENLPPYKKKRGNDGSAITNDIKDEDMDTDNLKNKSEEEISESEREYRKCIEHAANFLETILTGTNIVNEEEFYKVLSTKTDDLYEFTCFTKTPPLNNSNPKSRFISLARRNSASQRQALGNFRSKEGIKHKSMYEHEELLEIPSRKEIENFNKTNLTFVDRHRAPLSTV